MDDLDGQPNEPGPAGKVRKVRGEDEWEWRQGLRKEKAHATLQAAQGILRVLDEVEAVGGGALAADFGGQLCAGFFELFVEEGRVLPQEFGSVIGSAQWATGGWLRRRRGSGGICHLVRRPWRVKGVWLLGGR